MARLALSEEDKQVRDWFKETTEALGCKVTVDVMGNMFAVRPGRRQDVPPTFVGSHLDTQPTGGRYDGILGVCAGIEMLKVLEENGIETEGGVGVANWTKYVFSTMWLKSARSFNSDRKPAKTILIVRRELVFQ